MMEKLPLKYIPLGLLGVFLTKSLIISTTSLNEVLMLALLVGLTAFLELRVENKKLKELLAYFDARSNAIDEQLKLLRDKNSTQDKTLDDLKTSVTSVKISNGFKSIVNK